MDYRQTLEIRHKARVLAVDPSINTTGLSYWEELYSGKSERHLKRFELICPIGDPQTLILRVRTIVEQVEGFIQDNPVDAVIIEHPPETVYEQGKGAAAVAARAQSVFKLIALVYYLTAVLRRSGIKVHYIFPSQWQQKANSPKAIVPRPKGMVVKDWSLASANRLIAIYSPPSIQKHLHTHNDENIADAINIGDKGMDLLYNGLI